MKRILALIVILLLLSGCKSEVVWNGQRKALGELYMVVDVTNMEEYVGIVDYVFVGKVIEVVDDVLPNKSRKQEDDYSTYRIQVEQNLKGELVDEIIVKKLGGYKKDGTLYTVDVETPSGEIIMDPCLPTLGTSYIFMAYGQHDGSLLLSELLDDREPTESLIRQYLGYIENEVAFERERFPSNYSK